jgi:GTP cyclohydrolase I
VGARRKPATGAAAAVARFLAEVVPAKELRKADVQGTPLRVAEAFRDDLLDGYGQDPARILGQAMEVPGRDLVALAGIDFHAVCPHHLLPYRGTACVAYVPAGRVVGFGVLARLVDCFAHRLVIQEVLARQVADALVEHLGALGAACVLDAEQMCLTVRGERRRQARAHAQAFAGSMERSAAWQRRVLAIAAGEPRRAARRKAR